MSKTLRGRYIRDGNFWGLVIGKIYKLEQSKSFDDSYNVLLNDYGFPKNDILKNRFKILPNIKNIPKESV
jgi:hypothetical protein